MGLLPVAPFSCGSTKRPTRFRAVQSHSSRWYNNVHVKVWVTFEKWYLYVCLTSVQKKKQRRFRNDVGLHGLTRTERNDPYYRCFTAHFMEHKHCQHEKHFLPQCICKIFLTCFCRRMVVFKMSKYMMIIIRMLMKVCPDIIAMAQVGYTVK